MAKSAIVIELTAAKIAVLEIAGRNSGAEMLRYTVRNLPAAGLTSVWLKAFWRQEHFTHHRVVLCLPAAAVNYKTVTMPALPFPELEKAVKSELAGNGASGNVICRIIDYQAVDQLYKVKVAIIANQKLVEVVEFMHQAGLEVIWSGLRSRGLQNFINFNAGFFDNLETGLCYLDFTDDQTEFGMVRNEMIIFRRILGCNCRELENNCPDAAEDFLEEIRLSIAAYQAESKNQAPSEVSIFGKTEPVLTLNTLLPKLGLKLHLPEKTNLTGVLTHQHTPELAPLIGLAMDELGFSNRGELRIYTSEQDKREAKRRRWLAGAGVAALAVLLSAGLTLGMRASLEKWRRVNEWLQSKAVILTNLRQTENETRICRNEIKRLTGWFSAQGRELDFLLTLQQNLPPETRITDLTIEDGYVKDLSGVTPSVSLLLRKLNSAPQLKNLKLKGTISASEQGEGFQLEGVIPGKEQPK